MNNGKLQSSFGIALVFATVAATAAVLASGCLSIGDNRPECDVHDVGSTYAGGFICERAQLFAAEASPEFLVAQATLDRYFDRYRRAVAAEPLVLYGFPKPSYTLYFLDSNNVQIGTAWQAKQTTTGIDEFDRVFSQVAESISSAQEYHVNGQPFYRVMFGVKRLFSPEQMNKLIPGELAWSPAATEFTSPTATFSWPEGSPREGADELTATIDSAFAFNNCVLGCAKH
ncbi:MAG: hypothetical protein KBG15_16620, partial [Kofleriaceae bacterium]|nr:hypothetical protein [Kofleriaceae bacterium]